MRGLYKEREVFTLAHFNRFVGSELEIECYKVQKWLKLQR